MKYSTTPENGMLRIKALKSFGNVMEGDVGGLIEKESNLSQDGNAWVYGDAWVSGNAWVYGDARVSGEANIERTQQLFMASNVGPENGTLCVFPDEHGTLYATRGCFYGTIDEFLSKSEEVHDSDTHLEYRLIIEVAYSRITRSLKGL